MQFTYMQGFVEESTVSFLNKTSEQLSNEKKTDLDFVFVLQHFQLFKRLIYSRLTRT